MHNSDYHEAAELDQALAEERRARDQEIISYYKTIMRQLEDEEIPTPVRPILTEVESAGRAFESLPAVNLAAISQDEKDACANLKSKIRIAIEDNNSQALKFYLGPNFFLMRRKFMESTNKLHYEWLQITIQLFMVQTYEHILLKFIRTNRLQTFADAVILKAISIEQLNGRMNGLKISLLQAFSDEALVIPEAWQVCPALARHVTEYMQKLWKEGREKIKNLQDVVLAERLFDLKNHAEKLQEESRKLQEKQMHLNRQYHVQAITNAERLWQDFERIHEEQEDFSNIKSLLRTLRLAEQSLELFERGEEETFLDQALIEYFNPRKIDKKAKCLVIIQMLAERGGKVTEEHGGKMLQGELIKYVGEEVLKILLNNAEALTPIQHDGKQYFIRYTDTSIKQLDSFWWCAFHSPDRKRRHLAMEQAVTAFFYLPRSVDLIEQDQEFMKILQGAYVKSSVSWLDNGQWRDILRILPLRVEKLLMPPLERLMLMQGAELAEVTTLVERRALAAGGPS